LAARAEIFIFDIFSMIFILQKFYFRVNVVESFVCRDFYFRDYGMEPSPSIQLNQFHSPI